MAYVFGVLAALFTRRYFYDKKDRQPIDYVAVTGLTIILVFIITHI